MATQRETGQGVESMMRRRASAWKTLGITAVAAGSVVLAACAGNVAPTAPANPPAANPPAAAQPAAPVTVKNTGPLDPMKALPSLVVNETLVAPPLVPPAITRKEPALVKVNLEAVEQRGQLADGVEYQYWTFNGTVPGPMIRVRAGDEVELTMTNKAGDMMPHSIDLHAVIGPGGGAPLMQMLPGQGMTFRFAALKPGLYVYHCATPVIPNHIANGMYGMIMVEPQEGMAPADREYYVMQGDMYTRDANGEKGYEPFSMQKMLDEQPDYVVFNGAVGALTGDHALKAKVGETVRIFFGDGGPNLTSSYHIIGEIFDRVYIDGAGAPVSNAQTIMVPAAGSAIAEFKAIFPGSYTMVDHSLSRLMKGAAASLVVEGEGNPMIYGAVKQ